MLTRHEMRTMLLARGTAQEELFKESRRAREAVWGRAVILRAVIEVTNVCRVNCDYCPMRKDNVALNDRYSLTSDQIVSCAEAVRASGIDVILLQGGETAGILSAIYDAIPRIRALYAGQVEILLNLGNLRHDQYARFRQIGATSYIIKHETSDREIHEALRHESLDSRLECFRDLKSLGFRVGTGLISSLPGQHLDSVIDDIELALDLDADMCSVSPFVPAPNTPMATLPIGDNELALNIIACLRLSKPELLVPSVSALERVGQNGQSRGLNAGANVMTANFTSEAERQRYLIYGKDRFVVGLDHVQQLAASAGLSLRGSSFLNDPRTRAEVPA